MRRVNCWNHLEKLALFFLRNFHREHSLLKLVIKRLSPKINVKNIKTRVKYLSQNLRQGCTTV